MVPSKSAGVEPFAVTTEVAARDQANRLRCVLPREQNSGDPVVDSREIELQRPRKARDVLRDAKPNCNSLFSLPSEAFSRAVRAISSAEPKTDIV